MQSTVVNIDSFHSDEDSDYAADFTKTSSNEKPRDYHVEDEKLSGDITKGVANLIWAESSQRARKAFNTYTNIDILRPYFDVEPNVVKQRLISSLVPIQFYKVDGTKIPRELYGPNMIVLSLVAMLLMQMKSANIALKEGTLMGSALGLCFGYWLVLSCVLWFLCYIFNIRLSILQALHLQGYGLFGPCIVIFTTTVIHPHSSHSFFYFVALFFLILSTLKMTSVIKSRTSDQKSLFILVAVIFILHLIILFYIHFSYHHDMEELVMSVDTANDSDKFDKSLFTLNGATLVENNESTSVTSVIEEKLIVPPLNKLKKRFKNLNKSYNSTH